MLVSIGVFGGISLAASIGLNQTVTFPSPKLACRFEGTVKLTDLRGTLRCSFLTLAASLMWPTIKIVHGIKGLEYCLETSQVSCCL